MFKRVLLASDGSACADKAAAVAVDLARRYGAVIDVVSVVDPVPFLTVPDGGGEALAYYLDAAEQAAKQGMAKVESLAQQAGVGISCKVLHEHGAAQALVEQAQQVGADLIVMGSHGWRGLDKLLLGSVAQKVLTLSTVPVFVVK